MHPTRHLIIAPALLALVTAAGAQCVATTDGSGIRCFTLYAGQTIDAGTVCAAVDTTGPSPVLRVTYTTTGCWQLEEAHLWVGTDPADMPQSRQGNPKIGHFPYYTGDVTGATTHTFSIGLDTLGFACPSPDTTFHMAAHAALRCVGSGGGVTQRETGWSAGTRIVDRGNWATMSTFMLTCNCTPTQPKDDCKFTYALLTDGTVADPRSICFRAIDENGDGIPGDFALWGWTNFVPAPAPGGLTAAVYDLRAGDFNSPDPCNIGIPPLGTATIVYDGGNVRVDFALNAAAIQAGFVINQTYVYVGEQILPLDWNGVNLSVNPLRYGHAHDSLGGVLTDSYSIQRPGGDLYVIAHAVICR